jgi:hypothetical protein
MDPDYTARCHSKQIPGKTGLGSNYVQYENAEVDKLLDQGVRQSKVEDRKATYARIQEILHEEVPFAPQLGTVQGNLKKKQLAGVKTSGYTGQLRLEPARVALGVRSSGTTRRRDDEDVQYLAASLLNFTSLVPRPKFRSQATLSSLPPYPAAACSRPGTAGSAPR